MLSTILYYYSKNRIGSQTFIAQIASQVAACDPQSLTNEEATQAVVALNLTYGTSKPRAILPMASHAVSRAGQLTVQERQILKSIIQKLADEGQE
jgi:translation elongation factor EF-Ts